MADTVETRVAFLETSVVKLEDKTNQHDARLDAIEAGPIVRAETWFGNVGKVFAPIAAAFQALVTFLVSALRWAAPYLVCVGLGVGGMMLYSGCNPPTPAPPPGPGPIPPPPNPTAAAVWVMAIYDNAALTPATSALLTDTALWDGLTAKGNAWQKFTVKDARYATYAPILAAAKVSVPAIVILSKSAGGPAQEALLKVMPWPATSEELNKAVAAITGK